MHPSVSSLIPVILEPPLGTSADEDSSSANGTVLLRRYAHPFLVIQKRDVWRAECEETSADVLQPLLSDTESMLEQTP